MSTTFVASRNDIRRAIAETADTIQSLRETAKTLNTVAADLGRDARPAIADARQMTQSINEAARTLDKMAGEMHALTAETRSPLRDFGENGLYELSQFLLDARALMTNLNRIAIQFERDPARFLFGDQQKGLEAR